MLVQLALVFALTTTIQGDPDIGRNIGQLIESRGYKSEVHYVTTDDGYILGLYRIVNPNYPTTGLRPVILNHGLLGDGSGFLTNSPGGNYNENLTVVGNNLGFELAKRGYDVWLANNRGNSYSRNHTKYNPDTDWQFWEFSTDEMIAYDLPSTIEFVRTTTSSDTVGYVGHSQGTTIMFGLLSIEPKYNDIIKPFVALAPVTTATDVYSPVRILTDNDQFVELLSTRKGPFLPDSNATDIAKNYCAQSKAVNLELCANLLFFIVGGWDSPELNVTRIPVYVSGAPSGTSSKNIVHWIQNIRSLRFAMFDYGFKGNLKRYKQLIAPGYVVEKITNKYIALFNSVNDAFADLTDVGWLRARLQVKLFANVYVSKVLWNHLDFIWGLTAGNEINRIVLDLLDKAK